MLQRIEHIVSDPTTRQQWVQQFHQLLPLQCFHTGEYVIDTNHHPTRYLYAKDCIEQRITKFLEQKGIFADSSDDSDDD